MNKNSIVMEAIDSLTAFSAYSVISIYNSTINDAENPINKVNINGYLSFIIILLYWIMF